MDIDSYSSTCWGIERLARLVGQTHASRLERLEDALRGSYEAFDHKTWASSPDRSGTQTAAGEIIEAVLFADPLHQCVHTTGA
jgi:hypothetical protein